MDGGHTAVPECKGNFTPRLKIPEHPWGNLSVAACAAEGRDDQVTLRIHIYSVSLEQADDALWLGEVSGRMVVPA